MSDIPDENEPLGFAGDGTPITRATLREQAERADLASQEFVISVRRLITVELSIEQLGTLQRLFTGLGQMKNPAVSVSWWEGQIDLAVALRAQDALEVPGSEVEAAEVGHTLNRHPFQPLDVDESGCGYAETVPGLDEPFVCEGEPDSPPHRDFI